MSAEKCPVCGKNSYYRHPGEYVGMKKMSPDYYVCLHCGFEYYEDCRPEYSEEKMAKRYKNRMRL